MGPGIGGTWWLAMASHSELGHPSRVRTAARPNDVKYAHTNQRAPGAAASAVGVSTGRTRQIARDLCHFEKRPGRKRRAPGAGRAAPSALSRVIDAAAAAIRQILDSKVDPPTYLEFKVDIVAFLTRPLPCEHFC